jgi:hypothetical protein
LKVKLGLIKPAEGVANISLQYHAGRLLALHEADTPYALKVVLLCLLTLKLRFEVEVAVLVVAVCSEHVLGSLPLCGTTLGR